MGERSIAYPMCCKQDRNIIPIDGTHTCIGCGRVIDTLLMEPDIPINYTSVNKDFKGMIYEYCERGNIDIQTGVFTERLFKNISKKSNRLHKVPLTAACLYVACKKNGNPRSMKEIAGITGSCIKQMGRYEKFISNVHYPITPSNYIERFCSKLNFKFDKIKIILNQLKLADDFIFDFNPAAIACSYIYKCFPSSTNLSVLSNISGIPVSTIKKFLKKIK